MMQVLRAKIYGDSIMKGTILDDGYRYHAIMNEYLLKLYKRFGIEAENRSRFGITVERGHSILRRDIDEGLDCELALIEFGGNDSNFHWDKISLEPDREHLPFTSMQDFKHTMAAMTEELRAEGVQPVMMTLPPMSPGTERPSMVMTGRSALRSACLPMTSLAGRPLALAVVM